MKLSASAIYVEGLSEAIATIRGNPLRASLAGLAMAAAVATTAVVQTGLDGLARSAREASARAFGSDSFVLARYAAGNLSRRELADRIARNPNITRSDVRFLDGVSSDRLLYAATVQRPGDVIVGRAQVRERHDQRHAGGAVRHPRCWDRAWAPHHQGRGDERGAGRRGRPRNRRRVVPWRRSTRHRRCASPVAASGSSACRHSKARPEASRSTGTSGCRSPRSSERSELPTSLQVFAKANDVAQTRAAEDHAHVSMRARRHLGPGAADTFDIITPEASRNFVTAITERLGAAGPPISLMALIAAIVVVTNTTLVSVTQRTREIGIRRAIGASRANVLVETLAESTVIALAGGAVGSGRGCWCAVARGRSSGRPAVARVADRRSGAWPPPALSGVARGLVSGPPCRGARRDHRAEAGVMTSDGVDTDDWREPAALAFDSLRTERARSALAIAGIVIGIVTVVLVASVLANARNQVALLFRDLGTENVFAFHLTGDPYVTPSEKEARRQAAASSPLCADIERLGTADPRRRRPGHRADRGERPGARSRGPAPTSRTRCWSRARRPHSSTSSAPSSRADGRSPSSKIAKERVSPSSAPTCRDGALRQRVTARPDPDASRRHLCGRGRAGETPRGIFRREPAGQRAHSARRHRSQPLRRAGARGALHAREAWPARRRASRRPKRFCGCCASCRRRAENDFNLSTADQIIATFDGLSARIGAASPWASRASACSSVRSASPT